MSSSLSILSPRLPSFELRDSRRNPRTNPWLSLLELCRHSTEFAQAHAALIKLGLIRHPLFFTRLAAFCSLSPSADTASYSRRLFDLDPNPNTFAYNVMIRGHAQRDHPDEALALFVDMLHQRRAAPNSLTFPFVLKACSALGAVEEGRQVHGQVYKLGLASDLFVQNALILMYMRSGSFSNALHLFGRMCHRDAVSWNTVIDGLVNVGLMEDAQALFDEMPERNVASWNCLINGYLKLGSLEMARELFDRAPTKNPITLNTMISGYISIDMMEEARDLFDRMPMEMKNLTTLTVMIDGYAKGCRYRDILDIFDEMLALNIEPNTFTLVSVLSACSHLAAIEVGEWIHGYVRRCGMRLDAVLGTALVDMYAKCGRIEKAVDVFSSIEARDVSAWNSMITGLGIHGYGREALLLFFKMLDTGLAPNEVTFLSLLSACRHSGSIKEGRMSFYVMSELYGIAPKAEHYGCMVDLLCRAGLLMESKELVESSDAKSSIPAWGALLGASTRLGDIGMCEYAAKHLLDLDPQDTQCYVALSNMYSRSCRWENAVEVRKQMRIGGMEKVPGYSSIEVDGMVHEFHVGSGLNTLDEIA